MAPSGPPAAATNRAAQPAAASRDWFGARPWREWAVATGDWSTLRSWLAGHGVGIAIGETADATTMTGASSGRRLHARGLLDATLTADARVLRLPGGSALAQVQWLPGHNPSAALGVIQSVSNIDAFDVPPIGELWYQQRFGTRARLKAGRVDANSEFAYADAAADFLSASMGFSPALGPFPSYPTPASSLILAVEPAAGVAFGGGVFNGSPGDGRWVGWRTRFAVAQAALDWTTSAPQLAGRASGGWWRHDGTETTATSGRYIVAEQTLWADQERNATAFLLLGTADAASAIRRHAGAGVSTRGLLARRSLDVTGLGVNHARLAVIDGTTPTELVVEGFHRFVLTPSISVVPDIQLIRHPGGERARGYAVAFTCRLRFDL